MPDPGPAIEVQGLVKRYGDLTAVDGVDLRIHRGEVFALLGPNGAGKTTTIEILEGYRRPSAGTVLVLGQDPATGGRALRARLGIVLQGSGVEAELTPRETLVHVAGIYPRARDVAELLALVGLEAKADRRIGSLSGGQRRRLDLALALVGNPELLFLDEPTTGFDPSARREAWGLVERLRDAGTTVLLTTHYMDEAENLADRVAIIAGGRIRAEGTPAELGERGEVEVRFRLPAGASTADLPGGLTGTPSAHGREVGLASAEPTRDLHVLTGWAMERGTPLAALSVVRPSLEDTYLRIARGAGEGAALEHRPAPSDGDGHAG